MLDEMPMRGGEADCAHEDGARGAGAGAAYYGEVSSDGEAAEQVRVRVLLRAGGEEEEEREEEAGEVRVGGEEREPEKEVDWAEEGQEGERRKGGGVRPGEHRGGEAAREGVVVRRVRPGRVVVRERTRRGSGREGLGLSRRRAPVAAAAWVRGRGGGVAVAAAGGAHVTEGSLRG